MKCKISDYTCPYHACMSDDCQRNEVFYNGGNWGNGKCEHEVKTILSLFDYSGNWSEPYCKAGYNVIQHDLKLGQDIFTDTLPSAISDAVDGKKLHGILAAIPCTDFAASGARWWVGKENMPAEHSKLNCFYNTVDMSIGFALALLFLVELFNPEWWVVENPVGRLHKLVPEIGNPRMYFQPSDFGHPYTKKTALYGNFNARLPISPVLPLFGSEMWSKYGGASKHTKQMRSITPSGFAKAFFKANP